MTDIFIHLWNSLQQRLFMTAWGLLCVTEHGIRMPLWVQQGLCFNGIKVIYFFQKRVVEEIILIKHSSLNRVEDCFSVNKMETLSLFRDESYIQFSWLAWLTALIYFACAMPVLMACTISDHHCIIYNICRDVCYYCIMKQLRYVIKNREKKKIRSVTKVWKMDDTKRIFRLHSYYRECWCEMQWIKGSFIFQKLISRIISFLGLT